MGVLNRKPKPQPPAPVTTTPPPTRKPMRLSEFAKEQGLPYGTVYKRWRQGQVAAAETPTAETLARFETWLREVKAIDPAATYPGVAMSLVYELYRGEFIESQGIQGGQPPSGTILVTGWNDDGSVS